MTLYGSLLRAYGAQGWWPARTPFEVVVGAILTQGVAWTNVEKALAALSRARLIHPQRMRRARRSRLAGLIRPTGYFNQKAAKLKAFLRLLQRRHYGSLERLLGLPADDLRKELLRVTGIGPETADSIVLYAAGHPVFVVDAYTRRVLGRHGLLDGGESYGAVRRKIEAALPRDAPLYNEYHALLVRVGKEHCLRREALCTGCPLEPHLPPGGPIRTTAGRTDRRTPRVQSNRRRSGRMD